MNLHVLKESYFRKPEDLFVDDIKNLEREQHNLHYAQSYYQYSSWDLDVLIKQHITTPFWRGGSLYSAARRKLLQRLPNDIRGLNILDCGCGVGYLGMHLAQQGALVTGFDISEEAIHIARTIAQRHGLNNSIQFDILDVEDLKYQDETFDIIVGSGVLHHIIKYPGAKSEIYRVLKHGGKVLFAETLGENPLINWVRKTFTMRHNLGDVLLTISDIESFGANFSQVHVEAIHLFYMIKRLLTKIPRKIRPIFLFWLPIFQGLDYLLFKCFPQFKGKFAGECIVILKK